MHTVEYSGFDLQELYNRVKKDPDAIVHDVGEAYPQIIHEAHVALTYKDGSKGNKIVYTTFEFAKKHLREFKGCGCEACEDIVAAYRFNKKTMRRAVPDGWIRKH